MKNKSELLDHDNFSVELRPFFKKLLGATSLKIVGALAAFIFQFVISNNLGAEGTGIYFQILMIATIGALVSRIGLDNLVVKIVSSNEAIKNWDKVRGIIYVSLIITLILSFVVGCVVSLLSDYINEYVIKYDRTDYLLELILPLFIMMMALSQILSPILLGIGKSNLSVITEQALPMTISIVLSVYLSSNLTVDLLVIVVTLAWCCTSICAAVVIFLFLQRSKKINKNIFKIIDMPSLMRSCKDQFGIIVISRTNGWIGVAILSFYQSSFVVGQYAIAFRLAALASFVLGAVNVVTAPKFASLYHSGQIKKIEFLAKKSSVIVGAISVITMIFTLVFQDEIMSVMGEDFRAAGNLLSIIMIGQVINSICGPVGNLLLMSGHEKDMKNVMFLSFIVSLIAHFVLIKFFQETGAAIASTIYVVFWNLMLIYVVNKRLGFNLLSAWALKW